MMGADSRSPIAILIGVGDKRKSGCASLRVGGCAAMFACAALVVAAQQIGTLTPNQPPQENALATAQRRISDGNFAQAEALLRPLIAADPKAAEPRYLLAYTLL